PDTRCHSRSDKAFDRGTLGSNDFKHGRDQHRQRIDVVAATTSDKPRNAAAQKYSRPVQWWGWGRKYPVPANKRRRCYGFCDVLDRENKRSDAGWRLHAATICPNCLFEFPNPCDQHKFQLATCLCRHTTEDVR